MPNLRMNANKDEARKFVGCEDDRTWFKFESESEYLFKFESESSLDPKTSWKHLDPKKKETSIAEMERLCKMNGVHFEGGNLAEWRVYNLHRASSKVKPKQRDKSPTVAGSAQNVANPPYDPVKDAVKDAK